MVSETLVFIPAWNEEANLPAVLDELHADLPDATCSSSTTARPTGRRRSPRARCGGALVRREPGLRGGIAAGYAYAAEHGYALGGRVDADGQHPVDELARSFSSRPSGERGRRGRIALRDRRRLRGIPVRAVPRAGDSARPSCARAMRAALGRPFHDATSGMYAANARRCRSSRAPYTSGAPEVESLLRLHDAGLHVVEVPVHMRERASGESKLRGKKAVQLVLTVTSTLLLYGVWRRVRSRT